MPAVKPDKYFIGIVPPEPVYSEALHLKQYCQLHYHTKAALRSPPHITLHMPFEWKASKETNLVNGLSVFAGKTKSFSVHLNHFGAFPPRVIFVNVKASAELTGFQSRLQVFCRQELQLFNAQYRDLPFHPHITLAFRDLKREAFAKAWVDFAERKWEAGFRVESVALLKHDGEKWDVLRTFSFGGESGETSIAKVL